MEDIDQFKKELTIMTCEAIAKIVNATEAVASIVSQTSKCDHDNITTLIADFKNSKESQDNFHKEVFKKFDELQNNYSAQIADNKKKINEQDLRIISLETTREVVKGKASNVSVIIGYAFSGILFLINMYLFYKNAK